MVIFVVLVVLSTWPKAKKK